MKKKVLFISTIIVFLLTIVSVFVIVKNKNKGVELYAICTTDESKLSFGSYNNIRLVSKTEVGYDKNRRYACEDLDTYNFFIEYFNNDENIKCDNNTYVYLYNGMYYGIQLVHFYDEFKLKELFYIDTYSFISLEHYFIPTYYGFFGDILTSQDKKVERNKFVVDYDSVNEFPINPLKINDKEGVLNFYKNLDSKYVEISDNVITIKGTHPDSYEGKKLLTITANDDSMIVELLNIVFDEN